MSARYEAIRRLVLERSGVVLGPDKDYFLEARLGPLLGGWGVSSLGDLDASLARGGRGDLARQVVEALLVHETTFYRDALPFELLRTHVLPELVARRAARRELNVWCAAASSGQEPYSIAMLLREQFPELGSWRVRILGSDVSELVLARARAGLYSQHEVNRGLPAAYLVKYFERRGCDWQLCDEVRRGVELRAINLLEPLPALPPVDLLLLRNVLIYFDVSTRRAVLARVRGLLARDGILVLGSAETTLFVDEAFEPWSSGHVEGAGFYRLRDVRREGDRCT